MVVRMEEYSSVKVRLLVGLVFNRVVRQQRIYDSFSYLTSANFFNKPWRDCNKPLRSHFALYARISQSIIKALKI